ncbi:zf-HC2 domain-containing protein [Candidatus Albibeggiatoa sp. nov. NOAA]|uniref:anti-sigma factor family protein n=1 Tax=Candidatus Albibeggiatoa sp. nov. NOAA TaxID=3162724 RepID=UPI0033046703|nr:zf-HC2 domain-containing protein [Thiotrichaceae bacterium]
MNMQRLQALIGLIAQKSVQQQNCLSDEQLIDFINGELKGRALRQVQQHLQACPDCYQEWQQTCDAMMDAPQITLQHQPHWAEKWKQLFNAPALFMAASAMASIFAIVLLLPVFYQTSLQQQINQSFQQLEPVMPTENNQSIEMAMSDNVVMGFSFAASIQTTPIQLAFRQGFEAGQALSAQATDQIAEPHYYELGRWVALLAHTAQLDTELSTSFWQQQRDILKAFRQNLAKDQVVVRHLDKLDTMLQQLPNPEQLNIYDKLDRYTDFIQQDLS